MSSSSASILTDLTHIAPIIVVAAWGCLVLLADALGESRSSRLGPLAVLGLLLGLAATVWSWASHAEPATGLFSGMLVVDRFALFLDAIFLLCALLTVLLAGPYMRAHGQAHGEHFVLLLLVVTGMMLLVHAESLVLLLVGLETMSIGVYAMAASFSGSRKSAEAGFKYFVMGAVASAFLIYGVALLYGATGKLGLAELAGQARQMVGNPLYTLGIFMVLGAMAFKVALVPFHGWAPDAYEGAPTTVSGFMAAAVKAAAFGVLLRVFIHAFGDDGFVFGSLGWANIFLVLAILTMTLGNIAALRQSNIKRMLAYSSISHAGYILVGVIAAGVLPSRDSGPVLYYLLTYSVTTLGAFGMVAWLGSRDNERVNVDDWAGLAYRHPVAAGAMSLFLLSLAGLPPTAGFFGKLYIFKAALGHPGLLVLVIIAALNSVVSIYYYLRPVVAMYFREAGPSADPAPLRSGAAGFALVVSAILVLALGLTPGPYLEWAGQSLMALVVR